MKHVCIFLLFVHIASWSQQNEYMEHSFLIGETTIKIVENDQQSTNRIIFLNVHEDEETSIRTLFEYEKQDAINFFYLKHQGTRRIKFSRSGKDYDFDPNRIFTRKGRRKTLKDGANNSFWANREVKKLAEEIISRLPNGHTVVAMHNNTDTNYSIKSYLPGGDEAQNTAEIHVNPDLDPDDFIYTTDLIFFNALKIRDVNVILQDNQGYVNDGSLSVYCGQNAIPYINIETQRGHFQAQMELTKTVLEVIRETILD